MSDDGTVPFVVPLNEIEISPHRLLRLTDGGTASLTTCLYRERSYLLKRYNELFIKKLDGQALKQMIMWREDLPIADRLLLDAWASWPRFAVTEGTSTCGVLVPVAPSAFLAWRQGEQVPRPLDQLLPRGRAVTTMDGRNAVTTKINALGHLIEAVIWLHEHGVVVNDLHASNVLFSQDGHAIYLVDCDSMIGQSWPRVLPSAVPDIFRDLVPDADTPTPATDLARLAWTVVHCILDDSDLLILGDREIGRLRAHISDVDTEFLSRACDSRTHTPVDYDTWRLIGAAWRQAGARGSAPVVPPVRPVEVRLPSGNGRTAWFPRERPAGAGWIAADLAMPPRPTTVTVISASGTPWVRFTGRLPERWPMLTAIGLIIVAGILVLVGAIQ